MDHTLTNITHSESLPLTFRHPKKYMVLGMINLININIYSNYELSVALELSNCMGEKLRVFAFIFLFTQLFNVMISTNMPRSAKYHI